MEKSNNNWKTIVIENEKFSIRCLERDETFTIYLTNLRDIWIESLDKNKIIQKCKKLNPSLSVEDIDVIELVGQLLKNIETYAVEKSVEHIKFAKNLDGGIFIFSIDFEKGDSKQLWEEVTMPLCLVAGELQRRQSILLDLVSRKDEEITEYKLNGAELTRKHITTEPFNREIFEKNAPKLDTEQVFEAFKNAMETRGNVEISIKLEPVCPTMKSSDSKKSRKTEDSVASEVEDVGLTIKNKVVKNLESSENNEIQSSSIIMPKIEMADVTIKKNKKSKNDDREDNDVITRKKARSAPLLSFKRTKNSIHDFIK